MSHSLLTRGIMSREASTSPGLGEEGAPPAACVGVGPPLEAALVLWISRFSGSTFRLAGFVPSRPSGFTRLLIRVEHGVLPTQRPEGPTCSGLSCRIQRCGFLVLYLARFLEYHFSSQNYFAGCGYFVNTVWWGSFPPGEGRERGDVWRCPLGRSCVRVAP